MRKTVFLLLLQNSIRALALGPTGRGPTLCTAARAACNGPYGRVPHINGPSDDLGARYSGSVLPVPSLL
jgi:hypothetical protein